MFLLLLGCAETEGEPVTLQWYTAEGRCVGDRVVWDAPDEALTVLVRSEEGTSVLFGAGVTVTEDGVLTVGCQHDILILYAVVQ